MSRPCPCNRIALPIGAFAVSRVGVPGVHRPEFCEVDGLVIFSAESLAEGLRRLRTAVVAEMDVAS